MSTAIRIVFGYVFLALALNSLPAGATEEFKYYVWIDEQGIVHAEEEAPKGVDYEVRIIEDVNANVVPAEDFRPYGDLPVENEQNAGDNVEPSASGGEAAGAPDPDSQN